jgi:hypothetical protein
MHACIYIYTCMYTCMYVYVYVCMHSLLWLSAAHKIHVFGPNKARKVVTKSGGTPMRYTQSVHCMHVYVYEYEYACMLVCVYIAPREEARLCDTHGLCTACMCMRMYVCVCVCVYVCMRVCMCIHSSKRGGTPMQYTQSVHCMHVYVYVYVLMCTFIVHAGVCVYLYVYLYVRGCKCVNVYMCMREYICIYMYV